MTVHRRWPLSARGVATRQRPERDRKVVHMDRFRQVDQRQFQRGRPIGIDATWEGAHWRETS